MTPYEFTASLKGSWCGWDSLPPGFQFPVKELVACMANLILKVGCINPSFLV